MTDIKSTLHDRGASYGSFVEHARITQAFFLMLEEELTAKEKVLPDYQQEALHMVFHKLGRIINGDHMYIESWRDMVGYLQLVLNIMLETEGCTDGRVVKMVVKNKTLIDIPEFII